jgi:hypothetical protein
MEKLLSIFTSTQNDIILFVICCVIGLVALTYFAKFSADTKVTLNTLQVIKIVLEAKLGSKAGKILDIWIEGLNKIQDGEFSFSDGVDQFVRFIKLGAASKGVELSDDDIEKIEMLVLSTLETFTSKHPKQISSAVNKFSVMNSK